MTLPSLCLRIVSAAILLVLIQLTMGAISHALLGPQWEQAPGISEIAAPMTLGALLTVAALSWSVRHSTLRGLHLALALVLLVFGLNGLLTLVEAVAFLDMTRGQVIEASLHNATYAMALTGLLVWLFPSKADSGPTLAPPAWWRWVVAALAYTLLYVIAGMLIYPKVEAYYAAQDFRAGPWLIPLQLVRGSVYVACALPLLRSLQASRGQAVLAMAVAFPLLAGVAGLLAPNPIMPDHVRFWHTLEIGASNAVFGALVGWLFTARPSTQRSTVTSGLVVD